MYAKPHILYWKWNNDLLDKNILYNCTVDIINRSMFNVHKHSCTFKHLRTLVTDNVYWVTSTHYKIEM